MAALGWLLNLGFVGGVGASAAITGTASDGITEAEIVAGGETIVITLTADTWVAAGATFNTERQAIIDGLDSAGIEATGWNAEVRDKEVVGAVVRTSDTVVTITLTAAPAYAVDADETITVTVPASALTAASVLTATPTFDVTAAAAVSTTRGGWIGPEEAARLRKLIAKASKTRQRDWQKQQLTQSERLAELRRIYDRTQGLIVASPEAEDIAEAVRPFAPTATKARIPPSSAVDFTSLLASARATARLAEALTKLTMEQQEDESMILLMMAAA